MANPFELIKNNREDFEAIPDGEKEEYKGNLQEEATKLNQIEKTSGFKDALKEGIPEAAESFFNNVKNNRKEFPRYNNNWEGWVDDREREIIGGYKKAENWSAAKKVIENTLDLDHKIPRIKGLEHASGLKYEDIKLNL